MGEVFLKNKGTGKCKWQNSQMGRTSFCKSVVDKKIDYLTKIEHTFSSKTQKIYMTRATKMYYMICGIVVRPAISDYLVDARTACSKSVLFMNYSVKIFLFYVNIL